MTALPESHEPGLTELLDVDAAARSGVRAAYGGGPGRGYGGHTAALGLRAAYATVPEPMAVRQISIDFLRPAEVGVPLKLDTEVVRDGRTTAHRSVRIAQGGRLVAVANALFHRTDPAAGDYQPRIPARPGPERLPRLRSGLLDVRCAPDPAGLARQHTWIRPVGGPFPADARLHDAILLYCTDITVLWPALRVHGLDPERHRHTALGSVQHAVWFHRRTSLDDWLFFDHATRSTSGGLCHSQGEVVSADGRLVASVVQTGVLTLPDEPGTR